MFNCDGAQLPVSFNTLKQLFYFIALVCKAVLQENSQCYNWASVKVKNLNFDPRLVVAFCGSSARTDVTKKEGSWFLFQKEPQDFIQLTACQGKIDTSPFSDLNFILLSVKTQSNIRKDKCILSFFLIHRLIY